MPLLGFTVRNHKSIRDELVLDLTKPGFRTLQPTKGTRWTDHVYPLAGIFGGNATGKSAILDAFRYAFAAIRDSGTSWQAHPKTPRAPFLLDDRSPSEPSRYEFDFVHDERRHLYGFEIDDDGIVKEYLRDVPSSRWRTLLARDRKTDVLKYHPSVPSVGRVTPRELVLSRSVLLEHATLTPIARVLTDTYDASSANDADRVRRLASLADPSASEAINVDDIVTLLQIADIGVEAVGVQGGTPPGHANGVFRSLNGLTERYGPGDVMVNVKMGTEESNAVIRNLTFTHRGAGKGRSPFFSDAESGGTIAWLALMLPVLETLRRGGLYRVDEIDSSLHPHLLDLVLTIFNDPELNEKGAQLIFTSHESYILSPLSEIRLEPEQVWFTDKSIEGVTELTCLADFPRHKDANVAKRYLMGRYCGTPRLIPSAIGRLL